MYTCTSYAEPSILLRRVVRLGLRSDEPRLRRAAQRRDPPNRRGPIWRPEEKRVVRGDGADCSLRLLQ